MVSIASTSQFLEQTLHYTSDTRTAATGAEFFLRRGAKD
jgi:hypothetical protein